MSGPLNCVFLDRDSIDCNDLDFSQIESLTKLTLIPASSSNDVADVAKDADIIIVNKVKLGEQQFAALPRLKLVCVIATGTNNIDHDAAEKHGVLVRNVKDYGAPAVSQHVFMLILALSTRFLDYQHDIKAGVWQSQDQFCLLSHPMQELKGKSLGLIGYGHIAQAVEQVAHAFGMNVMIGKSLNPEVTQTDIRTDLDVLFQQADIISLHCPLSEYSRNLIAAPQFKMMKKSAIIINTARGGIVNEADLLDALRNGEIGGAGIDCLEHEPPAADDPMITADLPNLIITPHNAWGTLEARQRLTDGTAKNIKLFIDHGA